MNKWASETLAAIWPLHALYKDWLQVMYNKYVIS